MNQENPEYEEELLTTEYWHSMGFPYR
jgi:hypothetical protein